MNRNITFAFSSPINWWSWTETFKLNNYLLENLTIVVSNIRTYPVDSVVISFPDVNLKVFWCGFLSWPHILLWFLFPLLRSHYILGIQDVHTETRKRTPSSPEQFLKNSPRTAWFRRKFLLDLIRQL